MKWAVSFTAGAFVTFVVTVWKLDRWLAKRLGVKP